MVFTPSFIDWFIQNAGFIHTVSSHYLPNTMCMGRKSRGIKIHFLPSCLGTGLEADPAESSQGVVFLRDTFALPRCLAYSPTEHFWGQLLTKLGWGGSHHFVFIVKKFQESLKFETVKPE